MQDTAVRFHVILAFAGGGTKGSGKRDQSTSFSQSSFVHNLYVALLGSTRYGSGFDVNRNKRRLPKPFSDCRLNS